jgi:2-octaprenyl-6-methoxyphenol hydroxylase
MAAEFDIIIAGSGPVGMALAQALQGLARDGLPSDTLRVLHVGAAPAGADRPIALSWGSRLILQRMDCWDALPVTPITRIHVSQQKAFGRTLITAEDHGIEALGYVAGYRDIVGRLESAQASGHSLQRHAGQADAWTSSAEGITVECGPQKFHGKLLVLADGAGEEAGRETIKPYGQSAIVCDLQTEQPHNNTAWERFSTQGPLALLPHRQGHALVWTAGTARAEELMALDDAAFLAAAQTAFGGRLGQFRSAGPRAAFPLALKVRRQLPGPRVIPIGNAAQTLHPVAGQGLNLGLRDAWELAELVVDAASGVKPELPLPGSDAFAAAYAKRRSLDRMAMVRLTDGLISAFSLDLPLASGLRGAALAFLDMVPPARRLLSRRMMFGARALP